MSEFADELVRLVHDLAKDAGSAQETLSGEISPQWPQVQELGLSWIGIPEDLGGSGGELGDLVVVVRELARNAITTPIVEAAVAAFAVGTPRSGSLDTVAIDRSLDLNAPGLTAELTGVPFAGSADRLVLAGDSALATVALSAPEISMEAKPDLAGKPTANILLKNARLEPASGSVLPASVVDRYALLTTAALLGSAAGAYDLTRRYVQEREQFGAPLLKIPAVSAALAQMAVRIGSLRSALTRATLVAADAAVWSLQSSAAVASARITAAETATFVARTAHQLHGAIGVTAEYGLHPYSRALWAGRDAGEAELARASRLGAISRSVDETTLWDELTA